MAGRGAGGGPGKSDVHLGAVRGGGPRRSKHPPLRAAGGVSFRPEAGSQHLAFHSRERVLRCIDQYTARQYRHQSGQKEALAFARTSSCTSKTVSRVLYQTVIYLDVPLPVRSSHPGSGRASLGTRSPCSHTGVAPDRVYSDGLFPAIECALTALFHPYLVITSSISFRILRLTPVTPKRTQQSGSFRKRRSSWMSEPCRMAARRRIGSLRRRGGISLLHFS